MHLELTKAIHLLDIIYSFDYDRADFSSAKAVILMTPLCLDENYISELKRKISDDTSIIIVGKSVYSGGFVLEDSGNDQYPEFYIKNADFAGFALKNSEGKTVCASNDKHEYLITSHGLSVSQLRTVLENAGVDFYAPEECTVFADNRIVSFFAREDIEFIPQIMQDGVFTNFMTGEKYVAGTKLRIDKKGGIAFIRE